MRDYFTKTLGVPTLYIESILKTRAIFQRRNSRTGSTLTLNRWNIRDW